MRFGVWTGLALVIAAMQGSASAQVNRPSSVAGSPPGFDFPMSLEAVHADPKNHHVLYEDDHVRLLEVTLWPGDKEMMHGHAYPSIFAFNAVQPRMVNDHLPGGGPPKFGPSIAPAGVPTYPRCQTMGPQAPHAATIQDPYPQHFYRLEYKRLDGDEGFDQHWREWYPRASEPAATTRSLFHNDDIGMVEVLIPPGASVPASVAARPGVLAFDTPVPDGVGPTAPHQYSEHAETWTFPTCESEVAHAGLPAFINRRDTPIHYYRIDFKRLDGDAFAKNWKRWYPKMAEGPPKAAPAGS